MRLKMWLCYMGKVPRTKRGRMFCDIAIHLPDYTVSQPDILSFCFMIIVLKFTIYILECCSLGHFFSIRKI